MSAPASTSQLATVVLSGATLVASLAGLVVAIINLRRKDISCTIKSLSTAYVIFFVVSILAMVGAGGAVFQGTELGATAGVTILTLSSLTMFVIGAILALRAGTIASAGLRNANYAIFGIYALLSLLNTGFLISQRRSLVNAQPVNQVLDFVQNRFGRGRGTAAESSSISTSSRLGGEDLGTGLGFRGGRPVRV